MKTKTFLIAAVLMMSMSVAAHATTKWSLVGLGDSAKPNGADYAGRTAQGAGLLFDVNTAPKGSFEFGFLYAPKVYTYAITPFARSTNVYTVTATVPTLEIPLLLRWWLGRAFSLGIGGVYGLTNSKIGNAGAQAGFRGATMPVSPASSGSFFGAEISAKLLIPFTHRFGLVIDGRYIYGLNGPKWREEEGLVGFVFGNNVRGSSGK